MYIYICIYLYRCLLIMKRRVFRAKACSLVLDDMQNKSISARESIADSATRILERTIPCPGLFFWLASLLRRRVVSVLDSILVAT